MLKLWMNSIKMYTNDLFNYKDFFWDDWTVSVHAGFPKFLKKTQKRDNSNFIPYYFYKTTILIH